MYTDNPYFTAGVRLLTAIDSLQKAHQYIEDKNPIMCFACLRSAMCELAFASEEIAKRK